MNFERSPLGFALASADPGAIRSGFWGKSALLMPSVSPFLAPCASLPLPGDRNPRFEGSRVGLPSSRGRRGHQPVLKRHEHIHVRRHATTEVQDQAAGMGDELRRPVHDLL